MTLVIAAQGDDFVVVACDSRGTIETVGGTRTEINFMVKLIPVTKYAVILMYGEANPANYLIEKFRESLREKNADVRKVAEKFAQLCREEAKRTKDVPRHPNYFPSLGFVIAGLFKDRSRALVPRCYSLESECGFKLGQYGQRFAVEGQPLIGYYKFEKHFKEGMSQNDLCHLVAQTMFDTARINGNVGGKTRMGIIDSQGWRRQAEQDIKKMFVEW